jgi:hypothetical protein
MFVLNLILLEVALLPPVLFTIVNFVFGPPFIVWKHQFFRYFAVFVIAAGAIILNPPYAGFLSFPFVIWLLILPLVGENIIKRYLAKQKYAELKTLLTMMSRIGISTAKKLLLDEIHALELEKQGNFSEAVSLLKSFIEKDPDSFLGCWARANLYRINGEWEELVDWVTLVQSKGKKLTNNPVVMVFYLRALGEIGEINRQVELFRLKAFAFRLWDILPTARLLVFSFCGEVQVLQALFEKSQYKSLTKEIRQLWLGTAALASGLIDQGMWQLEILLTSPDLRIQRQARQRVEHPVVLTRSQLTPANLEYLTKIVRRFL